LGHREPTGHRAGQPKELPAVDALVAVLVVRGAVDVVVA
jgi:hypothetical protein